MRFSDIEGLEDFKDKLRNSVANNHIAHAQLFFGREGTATLPLAWAFATYLNCEHPDTNDACGKCASCIKMAKLIHPDLHFAFPVSATKNIPSKEAISTRFLPEWRRFLLENPFGNVNDWSNAFGGENKQLNISKQESREIRQALSLKPFEGKYKIMLLWLPEFLHAAAANALLKVLEEPPGQTIFLLVSNNVDSLLSTITSRTQKFYIRNFDGTELATILSKKGVSESQLATVVPLAEGSLRSAYELLSEVEDDSHEWFRQWMRYCYSWSFVEIYDFAENFHRMNKVGQRVLLQYGLNMFRESLLALVGASSLSRASGPEKEFSTKFARTLNEDKIASISEQFSEALYHLERNASPKILFFDLSLLLAQYFKA